MSAAATIVPSTSASRGRRTAKPGRTVPPDGSAGRARSRRGSILRPAAANSGGSSSTATSDVSRTIAPAATPTLPTNGIPVTSSPLIDTSTMNAAVTAEWPAVALVRTAAAAGLRPLRSSSCWRDALSSA